MARRIPRYRLHKPTGLAVVTLDGKDHYLGRHGTDESRRQYDCLVAEWLLRGATTTATRDPSGQTVDEILLKYHGFAREYYGADSRQLDNMRHALRPLRRLYGSHQAVEFGPLALKAVRQHMVELGWSRTYINHCVGRVKRGPAVNEHEDTRAEAEGDGTGQASQ